jgi:hypothetical protein
MATGSFRGPTTSAGELIISLIPDNRSSNSGGPSAATATSGFSFGTQSGTASSSIQSQAFRSPIDRVKAQIHERVKLKGGRPSDQVERYRFDVQWKPKEGSLGVLISPLDINGDGLEMVGDFFIHRICGSDPLLLTR